jgi:protein-S-isoprenylcysteine O-methyltransferase Ste14
MDDLSKRALSGLARFQVALALIIFLPAWSLTYWQGWLYWFLFGAACFALTLYFLRHDPSLVERRMKAGPGAESEPRQKLIMTVASFSMVALYPVSALDYGLRWSHVPAVVSVIANIFVLLALVRHPMYAAALPLFLATPPALGSWYGLIPALLVVIVIIWRLLDEERHLARDLPGYAEYRSTVRVRLVPGVW